MHKYCNKSHDLHLATNWSENTSIHHTFRTKLAKFRKQFDFLNLSLITIIINKKIGSYVIYVICICLCIVVSNTYSVVFLFCFSSSCCQFLWFCLPLRYSVTFIQSKKFCKLNAVHIVHNYLLK